MTVNVAVLRSDPSVLSGYAHTVSSGFELRQTTRKTWRYLPPVPGLPNIVPPVPSTTNEIWTNGVVIERDESCISSDELGGQADLLPNPAGGGGIYAPLNHW